MSRILKSLGIVLLALVTFVPVASAQRRGFHGGGGFGGRGFVGGGFYGGGFYGMGWGWDWGYPYYYGPYYGPPAGEIQIKTKDKGNSIFVDGGFAGHTGELKNFYLPPGTHLVELRAPNGSTFYHESINVLPGKTVKIHGDLPGQP